jgi:serine/threonine protein kinase
VPNLTTSSEFLVIVRKSGVLDEKRFAEKYPDESELPENAKDCAAQLIQEGFLTQYQAKQLLSGKFKGFRLGTYKILQPLGQGGMGMVFLGEHLSLKRKVAVKVLPTDKAQENLSLERFQREARAAAALDHPNIVRLHDISQGGGVHFLVMEYVEGSDLQNFMAKSGALHFMQAVQYIAQAAAGLLHAHEKGFVHRDIKPSNLMLTKEGTIKILDMGLARSFLKEEDDLTNQMGEKPEIAGTIDFSSPEQALGKMVDERTDIYSLGTTLFMLVTGHPPFRGNSTQKLAQLQISEPPRIHKLKTIVPEALSEVVAKMMAKDRNDRYQSMSDVIDALGPWLPAPTSSGYSIQESRNQADTRSPRSTVAREPISSRPTVSNIAKQNPWLVGGIAAGLLLIVGLIVGISTNGSSPPSEDKRAFRGGSVAVRPGFQPMSLSSVATACATKPMFMMGDDDRFLFSPGGSVIVNGIPYIIPEPTDSNWNIIVLRGVHSESDRSMPTSVMIPISTQVKTFHFLSGISGYGYPWGGFPDRPETATPKGVLTVIVRIHYKDGTREDTHWKNGEHFADYFKREDVPGSEFAFLTVNNRQIRYLSIQPSEPEKPISAIEFLKGPEDKTTPVIVALTIETFKKE